MLNNKNEYKRNIHNQFLRKKLLYIIFIFINRFETLNNCHKLYF